LIPKKEIAEFNGEESGKENPKLKRLECRAVAGNTFAIANQERLDRWRVWSGHNRITTHKQTQINGNQVAYNFSGQKSLYVNQKQTDPKKASSDGNY